MFHRDARFNRFLCAIFFVAISGCGNLGSGCGCTTQPLPKGGLPADQTVEGGAQVRVTPMGFNKLTSIIPAVINQQFANGFCVGQGSIGSPSFTGANYCDTQQGGACGGGNGCNVSVGVHQDPVSKKYDFKVSVTSGQKLNLQVGLDVHAVVPMDGHVVFVPASCNMNVDGNDLSINADITFGIDPATGELTMHLDKVNNFDSSGLNLSNCGLVSDLGNLINDLLNSFVGQFLIDLLTPTLDNLVQGFLPHPLGIEGMVDVGSLLAQVSPGTQAEMEMRMVPGGYVTLDNVANGGMSLGLITGINADWDPSTRGPGLASEPALCVPPIPAPDFSQAPFTLPKTARGTFSLLPAGEFSGNPDPASDLAIGVSKTTLDLGGHHAVTSGAMCLGVGTTFVPQLNLGTIGLLVPSLSDLGDPKFGGKDPILLVTRPQKALSFDIGDGTDSSPSLTIHIQDMEVDFYAFIYQRYVRAFTLALTLDVGVNLTFMDGQNGQPATVTPTLVGLQASNIQLKVLNSEFVKESPQQLESVLPTIFDLALPLLGNALKPINVPSFAGFSLNGLRVQHVKTTQDDFLAIYASLGSSQAMRLLAKGDPLWADTVRALDADQNQARALSGGALTTQATLKSVDTPAPDVVRAALAGDPSGRLPSVTLDVPARDPSGRPLEYSWNLNGGVWRDWTTASPLVIADRAFAWQGKYQIAVRARVVGDYHTTDPTGVTIPVIIDSVGPKVLEDQVKVDNGVVHVPAIDIVSDVSALQWAFGRVGDKQPWTDWQKTDAIDEATLKDLAADGEFMVFVKDEAGNQTVTTLAAPFHGQPGTGGGCTCNSAGGGTPGAGTIALMLLVGFAMFARRRGAALLRIVGRRGGRALPAFFLWFGIAAVSSLVPGCSCGSKAGAGSCEMTSDCADFCPAGQIPLCFDHMCNCLDDIPIGKIGPYSDMDKASDGSAWVSAYAVEHGDLVVAHHTGGGRIPVTEWEWVDGVPAGPVVVPGSAIRGGIADPGPDVGMYTSIAVNSTDSPEVAYMDNDTGSLKFAAKVNGTWQMHVIDAGTGTIDPNSGGAIAGMYSRIKLRSDDGRPGIAYMAEASDGGGIMRAELRYASAQTPTPSSTGDWTVTVVDTIALPPMDPNKPDPYPLPEGLGLFLDMARDPTTQAPSIAYYDRVNGNLKLAQLDPQSGVFGAPTVLDGNGNNNDTGWYPSVAIDAQSVVHVAYQSATKDDLNYIDTKTNTPELIDDGYRIVGTNPDGLPKPEFHMIGNDNSLTVTPSGQPLVVYQDSTSHELLMSIRGNSGQWTRTSIAGGDTNFTGAYGFFAASVIAGAQLMISNWVVDQPNDDNWVEIDSATVNPQ